MAIHCRAAKNSLRGTVASLFPKQNYNALYPNFHIHVSVNPSQTNEGRNWEQGYAVSFLGIHKSDFRYSMLSLLM
jgi:hypothetical protein